MVRIIQHSFNTLDEKESGLNYTVCDSKKSNVSTHPDMLEVKRQVSDKRFDQSFLHSKVLFCFFEYFIFDLFKINKCC